MAGTLGIIAGAGELPIAIAQSARGEGRGVFVLALSGMAKPEDLGDIPHEILGIGELGKAVKSLKANACTHVTMAGRVVRPQFSELKLDARGILTLPKLIAAARQGDDQLLRLLLKFFEDEGFKVIGSAEAAKELLAPEGALGKIAPRPEHQEDIEKARTVVRTLGALDIGQGAVVAEGLVLAVEAAEGTDEMLKRVAGLPASMRGSTERRRGVLVKAPKPAQERRVDLPVIGVNTVERAAEAGLAGIALQAQSALIVNRKRVVETADRLGIFVFGFTGEG